MFEVKITEGRGGGKEHGNDLARGKFLACLKISGLLLFSLTNLRICPLGSPFVSCQVF